MKDKEKIYDEEIFTLVGKIIDICKEHKIPFFTSFQYSDDEFCTSGGRLNEHIVFDYYDAIKQCIENEGINIDKFMFWVMRGAKEEGHSSIILSQLGIPTSPKSNDEPSHKIPGGEYMKNGLEIEIEKQKLKNMEGRAGAPLGTFKKPAKKTITESIEITTQEMITIATLKLSIANWLKLDDFAGWYEEEPNLTGFCLLLGQLEMSLIRRKQSLDEARKALLELKDE